MRSLYLAGMFMYRERLQSPTGRWAHAHPQSLDCAHTCQQSPEGDAPHIHVALKMTAHMKPWMVPTHVHKALEMAARSHTRRPKMKSSPGGRCWPACLIVCAIMQVTKSMLKSCSGSLLIWCWDYDWVATLCECATHCTFLLYSGCGIVCDLSEGHSLASSLFHDIILYSMHFIPSYSKTYSS